MMVYNMIIYSTMYNVAIIYKQTVAIMHQSMVCLRWEYQAYPWDLTAKLGKLYQKF